MNPSHLGEIMRNYAKKITLTTALMGLGLLEVFQLVVFHQF